MSSTKECQIAAVKELARYDHIFISSRGVEHFSKPFGFHGLTSVEHDQRGEMKGLRLDGEDKKARGAAAEDVAMQICRHLGVSYDLKYGRGSQLRVCIEALLNHLQS
jgi:hypothetical protein